MSFQYENKTLSRMWFGHVSHEISALRSSSFLLASSRSSSSCLNFSSKASRPPAVKGHMSKVFEVQCISYRVSNYKMYLLYALVCKVCAFHKLFSYIIMKIRHETNWWSWFWVFKADQKWKKFKIPKKIFFFQFFWKFFFSHFLFFWQFSVHKSNQIFETSSFLKIWHTKLSKK